MRTQPINQTEQRQPAPQPIEISSPATLWQQLDRQQQQQIAQHLATLIHRFRLQAQEQEDKPHEP